MPTNAATAPNQTPFQMGQGSGYRPSQWKNAAKTSISYVDMDTGAIGFYVFDATFRIEHDLGLRPTKNPVQTGANTTDHAFIEPAVVRMEIGMSDAMQAFAPGMWSGQSKSVEAFKTLVGLRDDRRLITLTTRLASYSNMLVTKIHPIETNKTATGLRAVVTFEQIFMASATAQMVSARPQTTAATPKGAQNTTPPNPTTKATHTLPPVKPDPFWPATATWSSATSTSAPQQQSSYEQLFGAGF